MEGSLLLLLTVLHRTVFLQRIIKGHTVQSRRTHMYLPLILQNLWVCNCYKFLVCLGVFNEDREKGFH